MADEEEVKPIVFTLPLTNDAKKAMLDKKLTPRPLVLTGTQPVPPESPQFLKSKYQIGSNNDSGSLNYGMRQIVFHHGDIPAAKAANVASLQAWKKERSQKCGVSPRFDQSVLRPDII